MSTRTIRWSRAAPWLTLAGLALAGAGLAWPEESLPSTGAPLLEAADRRALAQGEWALELAESLGLGSRLGGAPRVEDLFALLCPAGPGATLPAEGSRSGLPAAVVIDAPRGAAPDGALRVQAAVPRAALYRLLVTGKGAGRWSVDSAPVGLLDPAGLGVAASSTLIPLTAGSHEFVVNPALGARIERVALLGFPWRCVAPARGWDAPRALTYGDKARTMVQALGLEGRLPPEGEPVVVEGERYELDSVEVVRTTRDVGRPASASAWARARANGAEVAWRIAIAQPGLFTLLVRVHGHELQLWSVGRGYARGLVPEPDSLRFAWNEVVTLPLAAGEHLIRARVPEGAGIDVIRLVRRRTTDLDYLRVLAGLGLKEGGPDEPVTAEAGARNLRSAGFRAYAANFLQGGAAAAPSQLALVEQEMQALFNRPLSPVLTGAP